MYLKGKNTKYYIFTTKNIKESQHYLDQSIFNLSRTKGGTFSRTVGRIGRGTQYPLYSSSYFRSRWIPDILHIAYRKVDEYTQYWNNKSWFLFLWCHQGEKYVTFRNFIIIFYRNPGFAYICIKFEQFTRFIKVLWSLRGHSCKNSLFFVWK